ncbi:hypothetical protein F8388_014348 [Cannabis sativa]|uniref:Protein kinase domain-containing protein n=1 Tax=Cannabis sativa TaxID=3483 RepID=A0A7J6EJF2_CANSA|nr:hypothetical protein F8388_014348 [Cannabis sativa]
MDKYEEGDLEESLHSSPYWIRGSMLGKGGFGSVYMARMVKEPSLLYGTTLVRGFHPIMAVKTSRLAKGEELENEKKFIEYFDDCPYIIKCFGHDTTLNIIDGGEEVFYNVFLEYAVGGTLFDFILNSPLYNESKQVKQFLQQILKGVDYIHEKGFVHCDLKPENVLLVKEIREENFFFMAKIFDFGLAKMVDDSTTRVRGTKAYLAPECRGENRIQGQFSDIWAIGVMVLFMLTKDLNWNNNLYYCISNEAIDFILKCTNLNLSKRPSAKILLNHPFITNM